MVGRKIGQFQIEEELGVGGMGTVYKAKDTRLNRYVAIKALHPHVLRDSQAYRRFKNEAQISAQLSNPNVATLYDFIKEKDQSYLIMEYIDGVTIEDRLKSEGALSVGETIRLSKQILSGLSEAHRLNILHRDLKPANVMIKAGGYAKLMDFGIARLETATRLTAHNKVIGTVEYMAPELLKGKEPSKASDLYAVGVMIYEMLTGKTLFVANSEAALVYSIVNEKPKLDLSGVPPELRRIVKKLTSKLPQNRYWNTKKVLNDLEKVSAIKGERGRAVVSLPSLPLKWPSGVSMGKVSSIGEKITGWTSHWGGNKKTRILLLGSIIVSLFIVLAGSLIPSGSDNGIIPPPEPEATEQLDVGGVYVPEQPSYAEQRNRQDINSGSLPAQPAAPITPPVTIEREVAEQEKSEPRKKKPTPSRSERTPAAPVNISSGNSRTIEIPADEESDESTKVDENPSSPAQAVTEETVTEEKVVPEKETEKQPRTSQNTGQRVSINIPQQYLPVVFGQAISSDKFKSGQVVYFKADGKVVVGGATVIERGARVRARIKTNAIKKNGKTEFSIAINAVETTAKKWVNLVYPEYSLIQQGVILFPARTRLSRVKIKPQSTIVFE